jgi:hypothetical protein
MLLGGIIGIVREFLGIFCQKCSGDFYNKIFILGWQPCEKQKILRMARIPGCSTAKANYFNI